VHEEPKNPTSHRKGSTLNYAGQSIRFLISEKSLYFKKASFLDTFKSKHFLSCALIVTKCFAGLLWNVQYCTFFPVSKERFTGKNN
jgi:hypothetical protein